jgi:hypothetical protein
MNESVVLYCPICKRAWHCLAGNAEYWIEVHRALNCPGTPIDLVAVYEATLAFNTGGGGGGTGRLEQNREALRKALGLVQDALEGR